MKVYDILQKKVAGVITISADFCIREAAEQLKNYNIGVLVIINKDSQPVGIISERDIAHAVASHGLHALEMTVGDIMSRPPIVVYPNDDIRVVIMNMMNNHIRHLPVVDDGKLIGLISIGDVMMAQLDFYELKPNAITRLDESNLN